MRQRPEFCINCAKWYDARRYPVCCPACLQPITKRVVLWMNKSAYLVRNIERDNEGFIRQASVINGQWRLVFDSEKWEVRAKAPSEKSYVTITKWDVYHYQEMAVPDDLRLGDRHIFGFSTHVVEAYESILRWADKQK